MKKEFILIIEILNIMYVKIYKKSDCISIYTNKTLLRLYGIK